MRAEPNGPRARSLPPTGVCCRAESSPHRFSSRRWPLSGSVIAVTLLAVLSASCARFHPMPISADERADDFSQRDLRDPAVRAFLEATLHRELAPWPPANWNFASLALAALYFHPDMALAQARWTTAEAGKITAGERPNPSLSVLPAFATASDMPSPWLVTVVFDLPIETAGKRGYRLALARNLSDAARLDIASVAWQVRSRLRRALLALYAAEDTTARLERERSTQAAIVRVLEAQLDEGEVSAFEVAQARIAADTTQLALRDAERQYAEARAQLASAAGVPVRALDAIAVSFDEFAAPLPPLPRAEVQREALRNRADILRALAEYAGSESALQLEIAKQYPDVHLNPGYEYDQGQNKWALGLTVTLPLLNQNEGPIAEAEGRRREAAARFTALQAQVIGEVERAGAAYRAAVEKMVTADALVTDSNRQEERVAAMIQAGELSRLALLTAQFERDQNGLAQLHARVQAQEVLGQLEDAVERPLGPGEWTWEPSRATATSP
jgi:cobalt-zinc-cadmium efflux system outer membrane protein